MLKPVCIAGAASRVSPRLRGTLESVIHATVGQAVDAAGLRGVDEVDMVVTVASDVLDGIMVPPRSEIAASAGRQYLDVPSSAGHAIAAATVLLETGQLERVLLVGWGEGHKLADHDSRAIQADPFHARPLGAVPAAMAALQAQRLLAEGRHSDDALEAYVALMHRRTAGDATDPVVTGSPPAARGVPQGLRTRWVDGVAAVVLTTAAHPVRLVDVATASRGYWPEDGELDPAQWIREAVRPHDTTPRPVARAADLLEVGATTPVCELHAIDAFRDDAMAFRDPAVNASGGGAAACFGPATGLLRLIAAATTLRAGGAGRPASATVADLVGPIGQQVTVLRLERSGA